MTGHVTDEWCYSLDQENYSECEHARSRDEAVAEAIRYAREAEHSRVWIARIRRYAHADFVNGIGWRVVDWINDAAGGEVSEHAEDYLDPTSLEDDIEKAILSVLAREPPPRFFQAESPEEIVVPETVTRTPLGLSYGDSYYGVHGRPLAMVFSLTPEQEQLKLRIQETAEAQAVIARDKNDLINSCTHPVFAPAPDGPKRIMNVCVVCNTPLIPLPRE